MVVRRSQIAATLSTRRASIVQRLDGSRLESPALRRLFPRQFLRLPPRRSESLPAALADLARPIRFPQRGRGTMTIGPVPAPTTLAFRRLVGAARHRERVLIDASARTVDDVPALLVLAASGAPIELTGRAPQLDAELGEQLSHQLRTTPATGSSGPRGRELRSVRIRRVAHDRWCGTGRPPEISVLLASRRPDDLESALAQVRAQVGCDLQVLVGLHGDGWPADADSLLADLPDGSAIERFGAERSLGEILTALGARADAELVTKWDDDDWYGREHLGDLVRAYTYSGADVVGKGAEFVHLEGSGRTLRRFATGAEAYTWTLAGGTLLTSRTLLADLGGWPPVRVGVDRAMLDAVRAAGGSAYRTHGFQYVLRRRAADPHTWSADERHFAATAVEHRDGLDLAFADIESDASPPSGQFVAS